jgi:hypothetical protein
VSVVRFPGDARNRCGRDGGLLLKPKQGFDSLAKELWELYTLARRLGLSDLGTYNPASTLPGGGKSDHTLGPPAFAFDAGLTKVGTRRRARFLFDSAISRPEVHYVIFEDKIWSTERGLHAYTAGGHETHVHVSGKH